MAHDVFISYSAKDKATADGVCATLEAKGSHRPGARAIGSGLMVRPKAGKVAPMLSRSEEEIPLGEGWRYEPKWDGFRAIVVREDGGVRIDSRGDRPLGRYFPELVELLGSGPRTSYVMDGEIVVILPGGLEFDTLQLRLHPAESRVRKLAGEIPATFVAFDLVEVGGRDLRREPTDARRRELEKLVRRLKGSPPPPGPADLRPGPELTITPQTSDPDVALAWFEDVEGFGQDGIVAKRADSPYVEGERVM